MSDDALLDAIKRIIKAGDQLRTGNWLWLEMPEQDMEDAKWVHDRYKELSGKMGFGEAALQAKAEFGVRVLEQSRGKPA